MTAQSIHSTSQGEVKYWSFKPNHIAAMVITGLIALPIIIWNAAWGNAIGALIGYGVYVGLCLLVNVIAKARKLDQHQVDVAVSWAWWAGWFLYMGIIIAIILALTGSGKR